MGKATGNKYGNAAISGVFVFLNRLLIPFGLHHIPNTIFWFTLGDFTNVNGEDIQVIHGDINIFLKGDVWLPESGYNNSGTFQSGFFPFMMFGLPCLSLAFYKCAQDKDQAKKVASLLLGSSLISFFTGITEPLEFSFMFISPVLYLIHASLAAFWALIVGLMQIQLGFGFSAGFIDYVLSIPKSMDIINAKLNGIVGSAAPIYNQAEAIFANPGMLIPIGLLCGASYYYAIILAVKFLKIDTPGRGKNVLGGEDENSSVKIEGFSSNKYTASAINIVKGIGKDNITQLEWCATRLRFTLKDNSKINESLVKKSFSRGEIKIGTQGYQIIIGPTVEMMGNEINRVLLNPQVLEVETNEQNINSFDKTNTNNGEFKKENKPISLKSIGNGKVFSLKNINDPVFSNLTMGDGLVVDCEDGKVYSPIDGLIELAFPTGHAYGIKTKEGASILIHIGIDTVNLDAAKIFDARVSQGQQIKAGDLLCKFNRDEIINQGYEHRVIIVVTPDSTMNIGEKTKKKSVKVSDEIMKLC